MHLLDFLETVFSSVHELDTFTFKHSVAPANEISQFFDLILDSYTSITELNLENNSLLYGKISVILSYTPQIKILNIKGIELDTELRFSYLQELVELHMDYFTDCKSALVTISSNVFKKLTVTNVKMPSREATIDLNE